MTLVTDDLLINFRHDLKSGVGLWESLQKHNLTLQEVMDGFDQRYYAKRKEQTRNKPRKQYIRRVETYIYKRGDKFVVLKSIKNRTIDFGSYASLKEAQIIKEYFMENGWSVSRLDEVCKKYGIIRMNKHRRRRLG